MLSGVVTRVDPRSGAVSHRIGSGSELTDAYLAPAEQVKGEVIREGDRLKVYVVEVRRSARGPQVLISRTHPGLVKRLFELEVPEIYDGTVEVRSIAREAGSRTKIAVWSADPNVDPIGACVGPRGSRVNNVVEELRGEKVDIVKYSDDPAAYVAARPFLRRCDQRGKRRTGGKSCRCGGSRRPAFPGDREKRDKTPAWPPILPALRSTSSRLRPRCEPAASQEHARKRNNRFRRIWGVCAMPKRARCVSVSAAGR
jgi:hypothetical protein